MTTSSRRSFTGSIWRGIRSRFQTAPTGSLRLDFSSANLRTKRRFTTITSYVKEYTYLGIVGEQNEEGLYRVEQRNKFSVGESIEVMKPDGANITVTVQRIVDEEGNDMESAPHPKQVLYI